MLTGVVIKNFKKLQDVNIELGNRACCTNILLIN